jgi:hypothetical protein
VVLAATRPLVATIDKVYVGPGSLKKFLTTTAYEPVSAGGGVGDGASGVGVGPAVAVAVAVGTGEGDEVGVGVGVAAAGCEQAATRSAMPTSSFFITGPTLQESIRYEFAIYTLRS